MKTLNEIQMKIENQHDLIKACEFVLDNFPELEVKPGELEDEVEIHGGAFPIKYIVVNDKMHEPLQTQLEHFIETNRTNKEIMKEKETEES